MLPQERIQVSTMNGHHLSKPLFGGTIKTVIPPHFLDASNFRTIPDHQEVFVSNLDDTSIIFDVLERVDAPDNEAAEFHFDALAVDNEVEEDDDDDSLVFSTRSLPSSEHGKLPNIPCWTLAGYQRIVKGYYRASGTSSFGRDSQYVLIFLAVFRLAEKNTDIVISLNYPLHEPGDIEMIHRADTHAILNWIDTAPRVSVAEQTFREIIASFEILDWGLFDEDDEEE